MELPEKPSDSDCCGSGCTPCVFDVYEELFSKWKVSKAPSCSQKNLRTDLLSVLKYKPYKLVEIEMVTENTHIYTFIPLLPLEVLDKGGEIEGILPYEPGQHFVIISSKPDEDNKGIKLSRSYTPISIARNEPNCRVRFLIKLYKEGAMSRCISQLNVDRVMYMRGAFGDFRHQPNSSYIFICAGTGIAPIYTIVKSILQDEKDDTTMRLIFTCRTVKDIYFRDELREFCKFWNFTARIYVSGEESNPLGIKHDEDIQFSRISIEIIFKEISPRSPRDYKVLICGSSSFNEDIASYLKQNGVSLDNLFVF